MPVNMYTMHYALIQNMLDIDKIVGMGQKNAKKKKKNICFFMILKSIFFYTRIGIGKNVDQDSF